MTVKCDLFLYGDDSCLVFQKKNVKNMEKQLNEDFAKICNWFVDNKLSINFGKDKIKTSMACKVVSKVNARLRFLHQ